MRYNKKVLQNALRKYYLLKALFWLLQKSSLTPTKDISKTKPKLDKEKTDFSRIRCPLCSWQPNASSRWVCSYCEDPEQFFGGCGTSWNTFTTGGLCPGCNHQWRWTTCLSCIRWSLHKDWYLKEAQ